MSNKVLTVINLTLLVIATVLVLALTGCLVLIFASGIWRNNIYENITNENQTTINTISEPCQCGCPAIRPQLTPRIVNGEPAVLNSWPWQLLLLNFNYDGRPRYYCGASLITSKHVLTAAHCVFGLSPRYVGVIPRVHAYNTSTWSRNLAYMAESVFTHESYDDRTGNHDIAIIRLRTPIPFDADVSPICLISANLTDEKLNPGDELIATGWGSMESVNRSKPSVLQQVRLQFVPQTHPSCAPLVGGGESLRLGQMCAGYPPRAICFGDSGGPLVRSVVHSSGRTYWQQVGIMSGTVDCGHKTNYSDVYASVSHYHRWIVEKIQASP